MNDGEDIRWVRTHSKGRLEIRRWAGTGCPIMLLHEGLGSVAAWRDFPRQLSDATGRSVIAWSREGYGASDLRSVRWMPDYMHDEADAVAALMDAVEVDRAVLFGHSDGASIALLAAALHPARIERLILQAPHVCVEQVAIESVSRLRTAYATTDFRLRLARYHRDVDAVFQRWSDIWLDPAFSGWNIEQYLGAVAAPALLIQSHDDQYGTMDQLVRIDRALSSTTRLELFQAGHAPHHYRPTEVIEAVKIFLRDRSVSP